MLLQIIATSFEYKLSIMKSEKMGLRDFLLILLLGVAVEGNVFSQLSPLDDKSTFSIEFLGDKQISGDLEVSFF